MSVHKTGSGTWRVYHREGNRQRSKTFPTKADAERYDGEVKRKKLEGQPIPRRQDAPTFEELAREWFTTRTDLADKTVETYAAAIQNHVLPHLGHLRVHGSEIRPRTLAEWQRERLKAGAGVASIRIAGQVLSQILDYAVFPAELLEGNPAARLKPPKERPKQARILTALEVERLRRTMINRDDTGSATLISILAYVGIRPQDALALEWTHISTELQVIQKNTDGKILPGSKTGQAYKRRVNLPDPVAADLESWRVESGKPTDGLIFPRSSDGKSWRDTDYRNWRARAFSRTTAEAGLGRMKPYDLRHTCASLLAAAGWNHLEIAAQLGHTPATSIRIYQHLIPVGFGQRQPIDEWITEARAAVSVADKLPQTNR